MPTEADVIRQLANYGEWLETELDVDLACEREDVVVHRSNGDELSDAFASQTFVEPNAIVLELGNGPDAEDAPLWGSQAGGGGLMSRIGLVAAAVAVVVGIGWVARPTSAPVASESSEAPQLAEGTHLAEGTASSTTEPERAPAEPGTMPEPLYVLPATLDQYTAAERFDDVVSGDQGEAIVVGRPTSTGFDDVSYISLTNDDVFGAEAIDSVIGGVAVKIEDTMVIEPDARFGYQVDGEGWLGFYTSAGDRETLLEAASVVDGSISFTPTGGFEVIASLGDDLVLGRHRGAWLVDPAEPGHGLNIGVQSFEGDPEGLLFRPGSSTRVVVRGVDAILTQTRSPYDGSAWQTLSWAEEPGQVISLDSHDGVDLVSIAEGLRVVDADEWAAALDTLPSADDALLLEESFVPYLSLGLPIVGLPLSDAQGERLEFASPGPPVVFVSGDSSCVACVETLASLSDLIARAPDPAVRFVAVRIEDDPNMGDWAAAEVWAGEVATLKQPASADVAEAFEAGRVFLLDESSRLVVYIDVASPDAVDAVERVLGLLAEE